MQDYPKSEVPFVWPKGTQAELAVYGTDDPQRKPTESYFANVVRRNIQEVRSGSEYANLWLLIDSFKDLENPKPANSGFHSFFWAIEAVLGADCCRQIGKTVCEEEKFTLTEAKVIESGDRYKQWLLGLERERGSMR